MLPSHCSFKILAAIPNAKLLVETVDTENANVQASLRERFEPCGISMDSVVLSNRAKNQQYALYHEMDIALDPFPAMVAPPPVMPCG